MIDSVVGDATDAAFVKELIGFNKFDSIINCIGILNQFAEKDHATATYLNSYFAVKLFVRKIKSIIYNITKEYIEFSDYAKIYPYRSSKYVLRADQYGWDKNYRKGHFRTYFAEDFNKTILYKSDIGEFRIIAGYHRFLTETYGDYMNEPSVENSIKEVVKSMRKLTASERKE